IRSRTMSVDMPGVHERWALSYLFDIIFTRDSWMHRVDITRATRHEMMLTPEHDGRIVADVVAEWARRHGKPSRPVLGRPAGGPRQLFPLVSDAVGRAIPLDTLRWVTFGHVEADECGSMNDWLRLAPNATVAHTAVGCMVSVNDLADRPPRPMTTGEVIDLGGK